MMLSRRFRRHEKRSKNAQEHRSNRKITITTGGQGKDSYDLLVVACDPQSPETPGDDGSGGLSNTVMKKTREEKAIFSRDTMKSFTFQTTLIKVPKADMQVPTVRFFPTSMNISDGSPYGYRSETRKEANYLAGEEANDGGDITAKFEQKMNSVEYEYVTLYQLLDPSTHGALSETEMWDKLQDGMQKGYYNDWFPFDWSKHEYKKRFHTKYFNHFSMSALQTNPNNWDLLNIQGRKNTVYVHASAAFESVLHIYWYIEQLVKTHSGIFPTQKGSKIAVLGAGPSGLLIARKLKDMGYNNITVLEQKENNSSGNKLYAGKTQTNLITDQFGASIPAELGTCYLSPAYDNMIKEFDDSGLISKDQKRVSFDQVTDGPVLREIVTGGQFDELGPVRTLLSYIKSSGSGSISSLLPDVGQDVKSFLQSDLNDVIPPTMNFGLYTTFKGFEMEYKNQSLPGEEVMKKFNSFETVMAEAAVKYIILHIELFGIDRPFSQMKKRVQSELFQKNIVDFLNEHNLICLLGTLQYGYSVQGYGSTAPSGTMAAFYLLTWVTPEIFLANIENTLKDKIRALLPKWFEAKFFKKSLEDEPVVSAFTKGWGDVWKNLKEQFDEEDSGVNIKYNVDITKIERDGV